jgi:hypothetical protein
MAPTKSKEKLSAHDKSILSRETILKWYRAKRLEKLRILRDEIVGLSAANRDKLKAKIIENTKKELAIQKQNLTPAQRQKKAKEFADALFKFALSKQDLAKLAKKYEVQAKGAGAEKLYKYWLENNKDKQLSEVEESPRYLAMIHINKSLIQKEAFLLLGMIEKNWDKEKALELYRQCWNKKGDTFKLQPLWAFFTKERAGSLLGFYYGSKKIRVYKGGFWRKASLLHHVVSAFSDYPNFRTYTVTGWWTVDEDEAQKTRMTSDTVITDAYVSKAKKRLQGGGFGDEYSGSEFLYNSTDHIRKEFKTSKDSGIDPEDQNKILSEFSGFQKEINGMSKTRARKSILNWFEKQPKNQWVAPSREVVNLLSFSYGEGTGSYLYRYAPKQKKIYVISLQGADIKEKYFAGYLTIKNGRLEKKWHELNREKAKKVMTKYIKTMDAKDINREIIDSRLKNEDSETIPHGIKLNRTAGMVSTLSGLPKYAYHHELNTKYFDIVEKKLTKLLQKRKLSEARAQELARIRVRFMKAKTEDLIENDEFIREAIDENDKVKLEIVVDSKDEIEVSLSDKGLKRKMLVARKKVEDAETSVSSLEGNAYRKLEAKVEKMFGPAAPVVMWILDKFFKVKDSIKKLFGGKSSPVAGVVLGALGVKASRETIGSKKVTQSRFDKLLKSKRRLYRTKRKLLFGENVKLKGKEIIIPSGKGILFEKSIPLHVKGLGKFRAYPPTKKKGLSIGNILGRMKRAKYQYKDHKIVIENGTTIPKGTIIPKGAKIKRIK